MYIYVCNSGVDRDRAKQQGLYPQQCCILLIGWHYLSHAASLMRRPLFHTCFAVLGTLLATSEFSVFVFNRYIMLNRYIIC